MYIYIIINRNAQYNGYIRIALFFKNRAISWVVVKSHKSQSQSKLDSSKGRPGIKFPPECQHNLVSN